jgi:hypothetical protein
MVQDDRMQHATQERLVRDRLRRLLGDPFPDRIERGNLGLELGHMRGLLV